MTITKETLGYEDVEKYTWCRFRGRYGWVMDKGDHVSDKAVGRHILIDYEDDEEPSTARLHENLVNKYLRDQKWLWVDFGEKLCPYK